MFQRDDHMGDGCFFAIILVVIALMVAGYFIIDAILPDTPCEELPTESINTDLANISGYHYLCYNVNTNSVHYLVDGKIVAEVDATN